MLRSTFFSRVFMSSYKILKDIGIVGLSQVLTSLGSFLLLPIITKTLGTYDYGIWAQISITVSLLSPIAVMGLAMGIVRFLSGEQNLQRVRESFYSVLFIVFSAGVFISTALYFASNFLAESIFGDPTASYYIQCGSFLVLLLALDQIALFYFRIFQKINTFASLSIFKSIGHLIVTIILLYSGFGLLSIIISLVLIESVLFIISIYFIISDIGFSLPKFEGIGEILKYSLPLTPNSVIRWVTDSSDRFIVTYFMGLSSAGVYSAAYGIGNLVTFIITPLQFILFPELSRLYNQGKYAEAANYINLSLRYFLYAAIPASFGLTLLSRPLLVIITTPEFISGSNVIPFVAISGLLAGVFQILINITHLVKKTQFNLFIHIFAALMNLILNFLLVPPFGIVGAAFATFVSYLLMVAICAQVSFKYLRPNIDWMFISKSILSSFVMCFFLFFLDSDNLLSLVRNVLIGAIIYVISTLYLKIFNEEEQNLFKHTLAKITGKMS